MKACLTWILISFPTVGMLAQSESQLNLGAGLNNIYDRSDRYIDVYFTHTNFIGYLGYEYIFSNNIGLRLTTNLTSFNIKQKAGNEFVINEIDILALNLSFLYHFIKTEKIDLSTGYTLGYHFLRNYVPEWDQLNRHTYTAHGINLLNAKYFILGKIGLSGEIIIDETFYSNYIVGITYRP